MFGDVYTMSIRSQQGANTTVPFRVRSEPDFHGAFADITGLYTVFIRVELCCSLYSPALMAAKYSCPVDAGCSRRYARVNTEIPGDRRSILGVYTDLHGSTRDLHGSTRIKLPRGTPA